MSDYKTFSKTVKGYLHGVNGLPLEDASIRYSEGDPQDGEFYIAAVADGHGIGLQNVRDVADKHHGILETGIKNGVFTASLLMPLPEEKKPARKDAKEMEGWI